MATFADVSGLKPTTAYTASIQWGDSTPPTTVSGIGIIDLMDNTYGVIASHTYAEEGPLLDRRGLEFGRRHGPGEHVGDR